LLIIWQSDFFQNGQISKKLVKPLLQKYFCFSEWQISAKGRCPVPTRGALRGRHERWVRDAMDAAASGARAQTNEVEADGKIVWSWRPDAGVKSVGIFPAGDGGKRARSPGRARRKP
jgi:hypothetical protein